MVLNLVLGKISKGLDARDKDFGNHLTHDGFQFFYADMIKEGMVKIRIRPDMPDQDEQRFGIIIFFRDTGFYFVLNLSEIALAEFFHQVIDILVVQVKGRAVDSDILTDFGNSDRIQFSGLYGRQKIFLDPLIGPLVLLVFLRIPFYNDDSNRSEMQVVLVKVKNVICCIIMIT